MAIISPFPLYRECEKEMQAGWAHHRRPITAYNKISILTIMPSIIMS